MATVTVPTPGPAIRPVPAPNPAGLDLITRAKIGPERWFCAACQGTAACPEPGVPPAGWLIIGAGLQDRRVILAHACSAECLARLLPTIRGRLQGEPWQRPEPGPAGSLAALMRETPRRGR